jgi:hypothetical protein
LASEGCCFSLALPRQQIGAFKVDWIVCGFHLCSISLATCKVCGGLLIFDLPLQCYTSGLVSFAAGSCTCLAPLAITDRFLDCASSNLQCHAVTLQPSCDAVTLEVNATCSLDLATLANELLHVFTLRWVASLLNASPFHFKVLFSQDAFVQSDAGLQLSHRVRVSLLAIPVRTDLGRGRERGRERERVRQRKNRERERERERANLTDRQINRATDRTAPITFRSISGFGLACVATTDLPYAFSSLTLPLPPCAVLLVDTNESRRREWVASVCDVGTVRFWG